jgi:molybdopterin-guanine dinucleotide biosynthesis protein A
MNLGSIVLTGGRSQRMGRPKESLTFLDGTLLGRAVDTLILCTYPVLIVARDARQELPPLAIESEVVVDDDPEAGPLAAFATGLRHARARCDAVLLASCDLPFLSQAAVGWLATQLQDQDAVIPSLGGTLQPLTAIYRTSVLPEVERLLAAGERAPRALAERVRSKVLDEAALRAFDPELRFLRNVNTPEELAAARREVGDRGGAGA